MTSVDRLAVIGTGLIGTSIAAAASRVGCDVFGWDPDPQVAQIASERSGMRAEPTLVKACEGADMVIVCAPLGEMAASVVAALAAAPAAVVTDVGSVKAHVMDEVGALVEGSQMARFVGGHPMGGSERSGPEHASAALVDGIVWVITPSGQTAPTTVDTLEAFVTRIGAQPVRMDPARHDRLVAVVSHLPQIAATTLMGIAATEEADEPQILLLAAGGFRDLTRLAASNPKLWSEILLANREAILQAIDMYSAELSNLRAMIDTARADEVEQAFATAKEARLTLAAKPQVRSGVAVFQVPIPDRPGALAELTSALAAGQVNIEDLQIVHSSEGGRGMVHLTVSAASADPAAETLSARGFDPTRLA